MTRATQSCCWASAVPKAPDEIRPFLDRVLHGRPCRKRATKSVVQHYELIGGKSPFNELTQRQADALARELPGPRHRCNGSSGVRQCRTVRDRRRRASCGKAALGRSSSFWLRIKVRRVGTNIAGLIPDAIVRSAVLRPAAFRPGACGARARSAEAARQRCVRRRCVDLYRAQYSAGDGGCEPLRRAISAFGAPRRRMRRAPRVGRSPIRAAAVRPRTRGSSRTCETSCATCPRTAYGKRSSRPSASCATMWRYSTISTSTPRMQLREAGVRMERAAALNDHPLFIRMLADLVEQCAA